MLLQFITSPHHRVVPLTVLTVRVDLIDMVVRQKRLIAAFCQDLTISFSYLKFLPGLHCTLLKHR